MCMVCQQLSESIPAACCLLSSLAASLMSGLGEVAQDKPGQAGGGEPAGWQGRGGAVLQLKTMQCQLNPVF